MPMEFFSDYERKMIEMLNPKDPGPVVILNAEEWLRSRGYDTFQDGTWHDPSGHVADVCSVLEEYINKRVLEGVKENIVKIQGGAEVTFKLENCELEWDQRRGVLYVNNKDDGTTVLRIGGLPATRPTVKLGGGKMIDVSTDGKNVTVPLY